MVAAAGGPAVLLGRESFEEGTDSAKWRYPSAPKRQLMVTTTTSPDWPAPTRHGGPTIRFRREGTAMDPEHHRSGKGLVETHATSQQAFIPCSPGSRALLAFFRSKRVRSLVTVTIRTGGSQSRIPPNCATSRGGTVGKDERWAAAPRAWPRSGSHHPTPGVPSVAQRLCCIGWSGCVA